MVPEKPPRRSKTNKEPVTIDLTADESAAVAEPVRANDTDEVTPPAEKPERITDDATSVTEGDERSSTADEPASTAHAAVDTSPTETPRFDDAEPTSELKAASPADPTPEPTQSPKPEPEAEPEPDLETERSSAAWQSAAAPQPGPVTQERLPARSAPSTSTLVASGIFGGIVALLLAGSMQYAGYLPGATPAQPQADPEISAELASIRQEVAALANRPVEPPADLANRIAALESSASSGPSDELTQRLSTLEGELADLKSAAETGAAANADLAGRLQEAETRLNDRGPEQQAARAVAAAALKGAIDRGGSFEAELKTYETVAGGDAAVADLQPFAARGVLSRVELQRQASAVADSMIEAVSQPDPDQGIASRLLSSAMSVVKVRRVGDVEGDTPDAVVARFEDSLRSGDLSAAAREWDTLPEPAKTASQAFKQELDARIQVENLVGGALTRAIAGTQG
jgi:hypothetical protein